MDLWIAILNNLDLSRTEQEVVKRFQADLEGRTFLPIADILRSYRYFDESLELLTRGVIQHKNFTVARIVLVRELFQKGLIAEGWKTLEDSTTPLRENVLAQKLKFKMAILLGYESIAKSTYKHMKQQQMLDPDTQRLGDLFELSGMVNARERMMKEMSKLGINLTLPNRPGLDVDEDNPRADFIPGKIADDSQTEEYNASEDEVIGGFQVVTLEEVFHGESDKGSIGLKLGGIELDSTTLADIYENQGHFEKALGVYRRLSRVTPSNEFLKSKIKELAVKNRQQQHDDLSIDPSIADSMEKLEMINREIKFFEDILTRLN